jgi:DNA-binding MarR family transcriptional regulator
MERISLGEVAKLHEEGVGCTEIARRLGYSKGGVSKAIGRLTGRPGKKRQRAAAIKNLEKWREDSAGELHPKTTHGLTSKTVKKRYADINTPEGQKLQAVVDAIEADLGAQEGLAAGQKVILGGLRSKLIVCFLIAEYLDKQTDIIDKGGELLPCLNKGFLSYSESARRDLEALYGFSKKKAGKIPTIEELIARDKEQPA